MYAGRVLNGTGEGCPPFYPVISSPCIQKRCAAIVTSLSASNELHMIVCIQMFFVQKNFRLPDCIHCRPNAMRSPLLVPCLYLSVALYVCIVNLLSCFSSLAVCLFSLASIPYTYLYVIPMPPSTCVIRFAEFSHSSYVMPSTAFVSAPFATYSLSGPSVGEGYGERRVIPILSDKSTTSLCLFLRPK